MGKLADELLAKMGKGSSSSKEEEESEPVDADMPEEEGEYAGDEVAAMQDFMDAETAEEKAAALKTFIEICKGA